MRDVERELVDDGLAGIEDSLGRLVDRDSLTAEEADAARERVTGTTDLADLADCDFVVEAIVEDMAIKRDVFADLDETVPEDVVLATNTSTLSIYEDEKEALSRRAREMSEHPDGDEVAIKKYELVDNP